MVLEKSRYLVQRFPHSRTDFLVVPNRFLDMVRAIAAREAVGTPPCRKSQALVAVFPLEDEAIATEVAAPLHELKAVDVRWKKARLGQRRLPRGLRAPWRSWDEC